MFGILTSVLLGAGLTIACAQEGAMVTFDAGALRIGLGAKGEVESLYDKVHGTEYLAEGRAAPLLGLVAGGEQLSPTAMTYVRQDKQLRLRYRDGAIAATIGMEVKPTHATFELQAIEGAEPTRINWGPLPTTIRQTVGSVIGVVRDGRFAIGIQSLNIQTIGGAGARDYGSLLHGYAIEHDGGVLGSKIALFGCPAADALDTIGGIEVAEGLPHPMLDGAWGKKSPTARLSYFIVSFGEGNIDEVLEVARKGGFRYIYHPGPFETWGHFKLRPSQFPDGDESLKRCAAKAAERGIRVGVHTLSGFITTSDPYVTPVPDPRLGRWGSSELAEAISEDAAGIPIGDPEPFRRKGTLSAAIIGSELIRYDSISDGDPARLVGCERGAFGTTASAHSLGADIGKLADHGYRTFYPGIDNGMMDEMTDRIVELFNYAGLRQISFDGLEGLSTYGHGQYARNRFVKQCYDGWETEVISDASNLLHYPWHLHTRMNWGELTQSAKVDIDHYRANNCEFFEDNLFPKAMGWWRFGGASLDWEATRLEDVEYLLAKAAGYNACHGMQSHPGAFEAHGYGDECLRLVKNWDRARYIGAFTSQQREKLREKGRDFHLAPAGEDQWHLREVEYSPLYWMCPGSGRSEAIEADQHIVSFTTAGPEHPGTTCRVDNPFGKQPLRFELRVLGSFDYDSEDNVDLPVMEASDLRRANGVSGDAPDMEVAAAQVAGFDGYELKAANDEGAASSVTAAAASLPEPLNLSGHRGLGFWVQGDGKGELLFVQLSSGGANRQYYAPVNFTGVRYFEFPLGEMCIGRYYEYNWHNFAPWHRTLKGFNYGRVDRIAVGFNAIPRGEAVSCAIGGMKALKEVGAGLRNPSLELNGETAAFDDTLPPYSYLIYEGRERAEVRDANYRLLREIELRAEVPLVTDGENTVAVSYEGADGPAPWCRLEFNCRGPREGVEAQ